MVEEVHLFKQGRLQMRLNGWFWRPTRLDGRAMWSNYRIRRHCRPWLVILQVWDNLLQALSTQSLQSFVLGKPLHARPSNSDIEPK